MLRVGEILKKKRVERNFSVEDVEKKTKIRKKFLLAIEEGNYSAFSSSTYLRGFIKNYSDFLNLPTEQILAIFRREFDKDEQFGVLPKGISEPLNVPITRLTPAKISIILGLTFLILFFSYLFKGYLSVTGMPDLVIESPLAGEKVRSEKIIVKGKTDPNAKLTINNQEVLIGQDGRFTQEVAVSKNTTTIIVVSENKAGKKAVVERIIEVDLP